MDTELFSFFNLNIEVSEKENWNLYLNTNSTELNVSSTECEESYDDFIIEVNLESNNNKDEYFENFLIHIPAKDVSNRIPGNYCDVYSKLKKKHNNLILKHSTNLDEKFVALILDGDKMRTTRTLLKENYKVEVIHIVEINSITFDKMKRNVEKNQWDNRKIVIYNAHIMDYVQNSIDPRTNMIYLDLMCNFFDTSKTSGSQTIITQVVKQLKRPKIIFSATFCLRCVFNFTYEQEVEEIYINLTSIFKLYAYNYKLLIRKKEMRYNGQSHHNNGMMFVIFLLEKRGNKKQILIINRGIE